MRTPRLLPPLFGVATVLLATTACTDDASRLVQPQDARNAIEPGEPIPLDLLAEAVASALADRELRA